MSPMSLKHYSRLAGSRGRFRVCMPPRMLDQLCDVIPAISSSVRQVRITPLKANSFRLKAELSNSFFQLTGAVLLRVLWDGITIKIERTVATPKSPWLFSFTTNRLAANCIDPGLAISGAGLRAPYLKVIEVKAEQAWSVNASVTISLDPFVLLAQHFPTYLVNDCQRISLTAADQSLIVEASWVHDGEI